MPLVHTEEVTGSIPVSPTQLKGRFRPRDRPFVILMQQQSAPVAARCQLPSHWPSLRSASRVAGRGHLGVDLHRDRDLAVPHVLHGHARMHIQGGQQRATRFTGAMQGDLGHSPFDDAAFEAAVEVARLNRGAMAGSEYQAGFEPGIPALPVGVSAGVSYGTAASSFSRWINRTYSDRGAAGANGRDGGGRRRVARLESLMEQPPAAFRAGLTGVKRAAVSWENVS